MKKILFLVGWHYYHTSVLFKLFQRLGYKNLCCRYNKKNPQTIEDIIQVCQETSPDLIILDIQFAYIISGLKNEPETRSIPILFLHPPYNVMDRLEYDDCFPAGNYVKEFPTLLAKAKALLKNVDEG